MNHRPTRILLGIGLAVVLSACTVTVTFIGDTVDATVAAASYTGGDLASAPVADDATIDPGESRVYKVEVGSGSYQALYLYLDAELDLRIYRSSGSLYASSATAAFFAPSSSGITSASTSVSTQVISAKIICPGSCVIVRSDFSDPVYVKVTNSGSSARAYQLFATLRDFEDSNEAASDPELIAAGVNTQGALETLGDVDRFEVESNGTLTLDGTLSSGIVYEAEITDPLDPGEAPRRIRAGESVSVQGFELVRVYAVNDRAGSAGTSGYTLRLE